MIKFVLTLLAIYLLFQTLTFKYRNVYPSVLYFGLKGSGKSTWLTKEAVRYMKQGRTVYSNFFIPGAIMYDPKRLGDFKPEPESVILCDEIGLLFNNRHWDSFPDSTNALLKLERKYHFVFISATQMFDEMDKKIRGLYDHIYQVTNFAYVFCIRREIIKKEMPTEDGSDIRGNYRYASVFGIRAVFVPRWVEYFNSFEAPYLPEFEMYRNPISEEQIRHFNSIAWGVDQIKYLSLNLIHRSVVYLRNKKENLASSIKRCKSRENFKARGRRSSGAKNPRRFFRKKK